MSSIFISIQFRYKIRYATRARVVRFRSRLPYTSVLNAFSQRAERTPDADVTFNYCVTARELHTTR